MRMTPQLKENERLKKEVCKAFCQRFGELRREAPKRTLNQIAKELGISRQSMVYLSYWSKQQQVLDISIRRSTFEKSYIYKYRRFYNNGDFSFSARQKEKTSPADYEV